MSRINITIDSTERVVASGFLLEGKPRSEYEAYCGIFDQFITGPAIEGREISEVTEKYKQFYEVIEQFRLGASESNALESALYGVAIEAEMQGFIYGFKLYEALRTELVRRGEQPIGYHNT